MSTRVGNNRSIDNNLGLIHDILGSPVNILGVANNYPANRVAQLRAAMREHRAHYFNTHLRTILSGAINCVQKTQILVQEDPTNIALTSLLDCANNQVKKISEALNAHRADPANVTLTIQLWLLLLQEFFPEPRHSVQAVGTADLGNPCVSSLNVLLVTRGRKYLLLTVHFCAPSSSDNSVMHFCTEVSKGRAGQEWCMGDYTACITALDFSFKVFHCRHNKSGQCERRAFQLSTNDTSSHLPMNFQRNMLIDATTDRLKLDKIFRSLRSIRAQNGDGGAEDEVENDVATVVENDNGAVDWGFDWAYDIADAWNENAEAKRDAEGKRDVGANEDDAHDWSPPLRRRRYTTLLF